MRIERAGLLCGLGIGFVMAWARLTDPAVIRDMLLLREYDVFLLMGSAVAVAAIGTHVLRALSVRAIATGERVEWTVEKPQLRHVMGSMLFGAGWSVAGTCPGPLAAMIGEGRVGGLIVASGLLAGVVLQGAITRARKGERIVATAEISGAAGL
jgi:hypothetical protein